jgi:hypothetical protein
VTVRQYATVSAINLSFLILGFVLGHEFYMPKVQAQSPPQTVLGAAPQVVPVSPGVTTGSFGAGLILAHEIQSDSLVVNGYDLLKLHQNTLNYLGTLLGANSVAIQTLIENSKATKLYTIKPPTPAPAIPPPTEKKP